MAARRRPETIPRAALAWHSPSRSDRSVGGGCLSYRDRPAPASRGASPTVHRRSLPSASRSARPIGMRRAVRGFRQGWASSPKLPDEVRRMENVETTELYAKRWWALMVLCLSLVVIGMDNTVLNIALPTLVRDLHATASQLQWIVDSYTLVFAGLLLTMGSIGDRFGRKRALAAGLALFAFSSTISAFAGSATMLIYSR